MFPAAQLLEDFVLVDQFVSCYAVTVHFSRMCPSKEKKKVSSGYRWRGEALGENSLFGRLQMGWMEIWSTDTSTIISAKGGCRAGGFEGKESGARHGGVASRSSSTRLS